MEYNISEDEAKKLVCRLCACKGLHIASINVAAENAETLLEDDHGNIFKIGALNKYSPKLAQIFSHDHILVSFAGSTKVPWQHLCHLIVRNASKYDIGVENIISFNYSVLLSKDSSISNIYGLKLKLDLLGVEEEV